MTVAVTARSAGRLTLNVDRRPAAREPDHATCKQASRRCKCRSAATGAPAPIWLRHCGGRSTRRRSACRAAPSACNGSPIDRAAKTLAVEIKPPALMRPNSTLAYSGQGRRARRPARRRAIVVAAVDVGILNLTNYKPPSPDDYYLGQRALSAEIRDLYGDLIDGMQGTRGQIRSGGDQGARAAGQPADRTAGGALFRHRDGRRRRQRRGRRSTFPTLPAPCASWRSAWSKDKVGHGTADVIVRDPVVLTATLPRFLLPGDRSSHSSRPRQCRGAAGDYAIAVTSADAVSVGATAPPEARLAREGARRR